MASQLNKRCRGDHKHQPRVGNRCRDAACYPAPSIKAMLRGITLQAVQDKKLSVKSIVGSKICAMPVKFGKKGPPCGSEQEYGPPSYSNVGKVGGGQTPIKYEAASFKAQYNDEYTG